jgi:hypothetical protein
MNGRRLDLIESSTSHDQFNNICFFFFLIMVQHHMVGKRILLTNMSPIVQGSTLTSLNNVVESVLKLTFKKTSISIFKP